MAESINEIAASVQAKAPQPSPQATPVSVRGDDLIGAANKAADLSPEEKRFVKLFASSKEIIEQRINEDPAYGEAVLPKMEKLYGEGLANFIVDEADKVKIDYLKRNDPQFNSDNAMSYAWMNDLTLGQFPKILKGVGNLVDYAKEMGVPVDRQDPQLSVDELLEKKQEEFRLLEKAFPGQNIMGKVAAFITPGSPLKAVFNMGAKGGNLAIGPLIDRISKNPSLVQNALQAGAALGGGGAATGLVQGTLGKNHDDLIDLDRGVSEAGKTGAMSALFGAAIPVAAKGVELAAKAAQPYVSKGVGALNNIVAKGVEKASGTPAEALRAYNANPGRVAAASGTQKEIGDDLVDFLTSSRNSRLPETIAADKLLPELPAVDASRMIGALRSIKNTNPGTKGTAAQLEEWAQWAESQIKGNGADVKAVPAPVMRNMLNELQDFARDAYGKESNLLLSEIKNAARIGRLDLVDTALAQGGEKGKIYADLMQKAADKRGILKFVSRSLGRGQEQMEKNSERFIDRLFGPNKELVINRMKSLDEKFGTNFLEQAEAAQTAKQLGPNGIPPWFTKHQTGAALIGSATGYSMSGPTGAAVGLAASSPRVGAGIIGMSDKISGVARAMFSDPQALQQVAKMGSQPIEIRQLAKEIQSALTKDGPMSAGSVLRIAADTPYFVGLVNAFDYAQKRAAQVAAGNALQRVNQVAGEKKPGPRY